MINSRWLPVILLLMICAAWSACTQERQPCLTPKKATLVINTIHFKSDTAVIPVDSLLPDATFIPITAVDTTPSFYPPASLFGISLSPNTAVCQWAVRTDSARAFDTLTFYYHKNLKFISNACGYTYFYYLDSAQTTHVSVDSVHVLNPGVTNVTNNVKNVQIYIHRNF